MHQGVDLQLGVIEDVRGRLGHASVDGLPHAGVQADLPAGTHGAVSDKGLFGHTPQLPYLVCFFKNPRPNKVIPKPKLLKEELNTMNSGPKLQRHQKPLEGSLEKSAGGPPRVSDPVDLGAADSLYFS